MQNILLPSDDQCWQAVQSRAASSDTPFYYGVRSTGIYCRPSCPSRRPHRDEVRFFAVPDEAEAAGFRACLRCRPRDAVAHAEAMERVCRYIETHLDSALDLATLGSQAGLSPAHLQRIFKRTVGVSPREYAAACRIGEFKQRLQDGSAVTEALIDAGYGSASRVYENAPAQLGMTPTAYKRGEPKMQITYTIAETALGRMLVAATPTGLCAVTLGDTDAALEAALAHEFPASELTRDGSGLAHWVEMLTGHLAGHLPHLDLPLDVRATAFQRRVWKELQAIPYGETRSYTQVAEAIGHPTAARAVAQACASNPVALAVPCHRVMRGSGELSGYRWGVSRKQALLAWERAGTHPAQVPVLPKRTGKEIEAIS